ncbi:hypothetical protein [Brevibacillus massiliensis]|nr:hypothetical protein [Brevibacillus massiliensis]
MYCSAVSISRPICAIGLVSIRPMKKDTARAAAAAINSFNQNA